MWMHAIAVSFSLRPWIGQHVFASPEKVNMAVTKSDLEPKVRKNVHNFLLTVRAVSRACGHVTKIWKKLFSTWLLEGKS